MLLRIIAPALLALLAGSHASGAVDASRFESVPTGFTAEGHPYLGSPDADVVLEEWSDFLCPYCARHYRSTFAELLDRYVRPGLVRVVFRDLPLEGLHPTASQGHIAARCAGMQDTTRFWEFHRQLFLRQREWSELPDPAGFLAGVAGAMELDLNAFRACAQSAQAAEWVAESSAAGRALGFNGTPSFRVSRRDSERTHVLSGALPVERFRHYIDPLLAGSDPAEEPRADPPDLPLWARPEGFAPDPRYPGYNRAGDPYKGDTDAELVVIEFTDFECPACRRHAIEVQPAIDAALVATGRVLWISKHLPLRMHAHAAIAAAAAECAGAQGRYWQMHQSLFASAEAWAASGAEQEFVRLATEAGVDRDAFADCLEGRRAMERVLNDLYDAEDIVRTTPAFVLIQNGRGSLSTTPLPADQFIRLLESRLLTGRTARPPPTESAD